jgi:putative aldouronate transport system permease protein
MAIPVAFYYIIFCYWPIYGAIIAFQQFSPSAGIIGSKWVGLENFYVFFNSYYFTRLMVNTVSISLLDLAFGFPAPIILALMLNEVRVKAYKSIIQTVTYLPHFISVTVICGLIISFTAKSGAINDIIALFGGQRVAFLLFPQYFRSIYVSSSIWQGVGWGSIIYLAALSGLDPALYEAAEIDGAGRFRKLIHITLPGIAPTIALLLILRIGQIMNIGYEKIILLQNPGIYSTSDVISSFVYRKGLINMDFSYAAAVDLFNSVINFAFLLTANKLSNSLSKTSLW